MSESTYHGSCIEEVPTGLFESRGNAIRRGGRFYKAVAGIALLASIGGDISSVEGSGNEQYTGRVVASAIPSPDYLDRAVLPEQGLSRCPEIAPGALKLARRFVKNPTYTNEPATHPLAFGPRIKQDIGETLNALDTEAYKVSREAADEYGLTVHDVRPYIATINADVAESGGAESQLPFDTYLSQANQFLSLYGVRIQKAQNTETHEDQTMSPPTAADLETTIARTSIYNIMRTFAELPEEYIREISGLKHIILIVSPNSDAAAYAAMDENHDTIHVNLSYTLDQDNVIHEINHLDDAALCGGADGAVNDQDFVALNADSAVYDAKDPFTYEDIRANGQANNGESVMQRAKTLAERHQLKAEIDRRNSEVSFIGDYAGKSPLEDKADTGRRIQDREGLSEITNVTMPPRVVRKYEIQLARLAQAYPALAYYFMKTQKFAVPIR